MGLNYYVILSCIHSDLIGQDNFSIFQVYSKVQKIPFLLIKVAADARSFF